MPEITRSVPLTLDEMALIAGRCNPSAQAVIDAAMETSRLMAASPTLSEREVRMVQAVVAKAESSGHLCFSLTNIRVCACCGHEDGYFLHARSTRYHRKGDKNFDQPRMFRAWEMHVGGVRMERHILLGVCVYCRDRVLPVLAPLLETVEAYIPKEITGHPSRFLRFDRCACVCGWEGHEGEMGKGPALFNPDVRIPMRCPKCGAERGFFGGSIKNVEGFALVPNPAFSE